MRSKLPTIGAWIAAALLHVLWAYWPIAPYLTPVASQTPSQEQAEIIVERAEQERPVVHSSRVLNSLDDKTPAPYHGEFRNRVAKQTRSFLTGRFQEGTKLPALRGGYDAESQIVALDHEILRAQTPNRLPDDIEKGPETILNTDPVQYASFINRIADEIYDAWVERVQSIVDRSQVHQNHLSANLYVTRLEIIMDPKGSVLSTRVLASSGNDLLDAAPKEAFWDIGNFPHPPQQLLKEDGLARFVYEFQFEWKTSGFQILPALL